MTIFALQTLREWNEMKTKSKFLWKFSVSAVQCIGSPLFSAKGNELCSFSLVCVKSKDLLWNREKKQKKNVWSQDKCKTKSCFELVQINFVEKQKRFAYWQKLAIKGNAPKRGKLNEN